MKAQIKFIGMTRIIVLILFKNEFSSQFTLADEEPRNEVSDDCHIFKFAQSCRMLLIAKKSVVYLRTLRQIWCITYLKECQFYVSPKSCVLCSIVISSPKPKCKIHSTSLKQKKKPLVLQTIIYSYLTSQCPLSFILVSPIKFVAF